MTADELKVRIELQAERIFGSWRGAGKRGVMRLIYDGILFGMKLGREQSAVSCDAYIGDRRKDTRESVAKDIKAGIEAAGSQRVGVE